MNRSDTINALAAAMAKAQMELEGAPKDSINPHFKSKYADLSAVFAACQKVLPKNGIAVFQPVTVSNGEVVVTTMLVHTSGEFISTDLPLIPTQITPQAVGSAITYGRRYGLSAMCGVCPEDDDGNSASVPQEPRQSPQARPAAATGARPARGQWNAHPKPNGASLPSDEPPPISDKDIPFAWMLPLVGSVLMFGQLLT